uniref:Putative ovule protein n=1 Tax=Solanum chacoense TaxID=4108 RepID=A0A0V0H0W5_SOLCH
MQFKMTRLPMTGSVLCRKIHNNSKFHPKQVNSVFSFNLTATRIAFFFPSFSHLDENLAQKDFKRKR